MKKTLLVSINGEIFKPEEAKISVFDRGFMYGDAVYEVARTYGRIFFELEKHLERMFKSAEMIGMDLGQNVDAYIRDIYSVYSHVPKENIYMRIQVTRGTGTIGLSAANATKPNVIIYIRDLDPSPEIHYLEGVKIVTTSRLRNSKRALDPNIKSGNYLNNVLAYMDASKVKAYDSIMMNSQGFLTEGTTSNIFMVKDGIVISPPDDFDLLRGITRGIVVRLCKELGIHYLEKGFTSSELENASEAFLTSSTKEVLPVGVVNEKKIKAPGPVTRNLMSAYKDHVKKYCDERTHLGKVEN